MNTFKTIIKKISIVGLSFTLAFSFLIPQLIKAQESPISSPVSFPLEQEQLNQTEESALDNAKNKFDGFSESEIADATAKVKDALIKPSNDDFYVVKFKDEASADKVSEEVAPGNVVDQRYTALLGENTRLIKIDNDEEKVDQMTRFNLDDNVEYVETNQIVKKEAWTTTSTTAKPSDFNNTNHWYHLKTKLSETYKDEGCPAANACGGSSSVTVAILDTGLAFENNTGATYREYLGGSSFADRTPLNFSTASELSGVTVWTNPSENYTGHDEDGNFICDDLHGADMIAVVDNLSLLNASQWSDACNNSTAWVTKEGHPNDDDGHGTYVANMIASLVDNSTSSFGAAFKTQLMPIKVLDYTGTGTTFTIAQGIRYAVNKGARILNISIAGLTTPSATLEDAISYARGFGALIVISSGNQGLSSLEYPSAYSNSYDNVISVGATNTSDTRASYSSYGTGLDLVAPVGTGASAGNATYGQTFNDADSWAAAPLVGRDFSTFTNKYWIGTSFAAPQVTSASALLWAEFTTLNPALIKSYIKSSATDVGTAGYDTQTGYGILNIKLARDQISLGVGFPWVGSGNTNGDVFMAEINNRLYQSIVISDGNILTRTTDGTLDGGNNPIWTPWLSDGLTTNGKVYYAKSGSKLIQSRVYAGVVYTRYSIGTLNAGIPVWSAWIGTGNTNGDVIMASVNGTLFQSIVVSTYIILTRATDGSIDSGGHLVWTPWLGDTTTTGGTLFMSVSNGKLYQSEVNSGIAYTRYTTGSIVGGYPVWGPWDGSGNTNGAIYMAEVSGRLFQSIVVSTYIILTRSTDGTLDGSNKPVWTPWVGDSTTTGNKVFMTSSNGKLYQSEVNNGISYTRYATGAVSGGFPVWGPWDGSGNTNGDIFMADLNGRLFQSIVLPNKTMQMRSTTGAIDSGTSKTVWTAWTADRIASNGKVYMQYSNNKLYQAVVTSGLVYTRYFIPVP